MTTEFITFLAVIGAGVVLVALAAFWWINRTPSVEREGAPLPLFGGLTSDQPTTMPSAPRALAATAVPAAAPFRPAPVPSSAPSPARPNPLPPVVPAPVATAEASPRPRPVIREFVSGLPPQAAPAADGWCLDGTPAPAAASSASAPAAAAPASAVMNDAGVPGTMVEGHALRYSVPADGTLQFLPGRLEIGSGLDANREIRFVRVDGPNGIEVTFGRSEGALYKHIQLRDKTVSRAHARMHFAQGTWHLQNLSQTNPVVHNGMEMPPTLERPLADGDRIEMGEVMFTFRER
jgi:hypothetical protein